MTKIILPLLAMLALLGDAHAQTARPNALAANPGSRAQRAPTQAELASQQKQKCQDNYAHAVGNLAYLEARLNLTPTQQPLFDRWKSAKLDNARRDAAACATRELPGLQSKEATQLDGMMRDQENVRRRLADLDAEIPVLTAFYNVLTQAQKDVLEEPAKQAAARQRALANVPAPQNGAGASPNPPAQ